MSGGTVSAAALAEKVELWRSHGGRLSSLDETTQRTIHRIEHGQATVSIDVADRILVRLGLQDMLDELAGPPEPGRSGLWSRPHPSRKLTAEQVAAAHRLHAAGMSIRELGRQLWLKLGYASPGSCANALCDAFKRSGLPRRPAVEATIARSTTHGLCRAGGDRQLFLEHRGRLRRERGEIQAVPCAGEVAGRPCRRWAMRGSSFCVNHDPSRREQLAEQLAAMRSRVRR